jgi:hypothetical protein
MAQGIDGVLGNLYAYVAQLQKRCETAMNVMMASLETWAKAEHAYDGPGTTRRRSPGLRPK